MPNTPLTMFRAVGSRDVVTNPVRIEITYTDQCVADILNRYIDDMVYPTEFIFVKGDYIAKEPINVYKSNIKIIGNGSTIHVGKSVEYLFYVSNHSSPTIDGIVYPIKDETEPNSFVVKADGAYRYFKRGSDIVIKSSECNDIYRNIVDVKHYECFDKLLVDAPIPCPLVHHFAKGSSEISLYHNQRVRNIEIESFLVKEGTLVFLIDNAENISISDVDVEKDEKIATVYKDVKNVTFTRCKSLREKYAFEFQGSLCLFRECKGGVWVFPSTVGPNVFYDHDGIVTCDEAWGTVTNDEEYDQDRVVYIRKNNEYYIN